MNKFPVTYVLYSHFSQNEKEDFASYTHAKEQDEQRQNLDKVMRGLEGIKFLEKYFGGLRELLNTPGHEGILVLFYAAGFEDFLDNLSKTKPELIKDHKKLDFAIRFATVFTELLRANDLDQRVRMVTSLDLHDILGRVNPMIAEKAHVNVVGPEPGIRYDSPKIPEAILRLRLLGHGVPVLRVDQDVLFRNPKESDLGLFKVVSCAVLAYKLRLQDSSVATFMFSASYSTKALVDPSLASDPFEAWGGAFATRIYPALSVDLNEIKRISSISNEKDKNDEWDGYARNHVDKDLAQLYYGLKPSLIEGEGTRGLTEIGAHPFHSVISGALLCLSEGAILDLPPFSNFGYNVMWIDDHLKYSLHREMRHFTSAEELEMNPDLGAARLNGVFVTKARPPVQNLPGYTLGVYLPTLLWGTILDAWVTPNPILKVRYGTLNKNEKVSWSSVRSTSAQAPLPHAMREALNRGHLEDAAARNLKRQLIDSAVNRIEVVRQRWSDLQNGDKRSFASYWARGEVERNFPREPFAQFTNSWWKGLASKPVTMFEDLPQPILIAVDKLADDAVTYVKWTLEWPTYVQIVRSVEQGTFVGDLTWQSSP
jgi:hypothetical protein